jgi:hypothetical protein
VEERDVRLPAQLALDGKVLGNAVRQLSRAETPCKATLRADYGGRGRWLLTQENGRKTLIVPRRVPPPGDVDEVLTWTRSYWYARKTSAVSWSRCTCSAGRLAGCFQNL